MSKSLVPNPKFRAFDDDGDPLSGGKVYFFQAGTSTPKDTFTDRDGGTANANPVILDANGEANIWYTPNELYKVRLDSSTDVTRWTEDDVSPGGSDSVVIQTVSSIAALKALNGGSSEIVNVLGYYVDGDKGGGTFYWDSASTSTNDNGVIIIPDALPATGRWVRNFEGDVSIRWFGAKGDYTAATGTGTDDKTAIDATGTYCDTNDLNMRVPIGAFFMSDYVTIPVGIIGDQKGKIETNVAYGSATWDTIPSTDLTGSVFVWDRAVLGVSDVYIRNTSGGATQDVKYKNMTFISESTGGVGGGKLLVNDAVPSGTVFNFGQSPTFEDCHIVNFGTAITINEYDTWTISTINFIGCQQPILAGNSTGPDLATDIKVLNCQFQTCGDTSTSFIELDNVTGFLFEGCMFEKTSDISIRIGLNNALTFDNCYMNDISLNSAGDFITVSSTVGYNCDNVSFYNCTGGGAVGDINLIQGANFSTLFIENCTITGAQIPLGTSNVILTEVGLVTTSGTTGTGVINRFTTAAFQARGIKFDVSSQQRQIELTTSDGSDDESLNISAAGSGDLTRGPNIELFGDDHAVTPSDVNISAGTGGTNEGDVNITPGTGQHINLGQIGSDVDLDVVGKGIKIKEGSNAYMGTATLVAGTATVSTTRALTGSRIFLSPYEDTAGTPSSGVIMVTSISNGVNFVISAYTIATTPTVETAYTGRVDWIIFAQS